MVEEAQLGFGLGGADSARLFRAGRLARSTRTRGRRTPPRPTAAARTAAGAFATTASLDQGRGERLRRGGHAVQINEVESNGGTPGDWIELSTPAPTPANISGLSCRTTTTRTPTRCRQERRSPPAATTCSRRPRSASGSAPPTARGSSTPTGALLDSYAWTAHATTTYGRCPNGTGAFATTTSVDQGRGQRLPGRLRRRGPATGAVQTVDGLNVFGGNMSGLVYEGSGGATPGVLWAARNGPGTLFRLVWDRRRHLDA